MRKETRAEKIERKRMYRPIWQIVLIFPLWLLYVPARAYVNFMDRRV